MKKLIGLILLFTLSAHADETFRTFTANDGRTLKAKIISYDTASDKVHIQREDKKKLTVPSTAFSEEDQTYIQKWNVGQLFISESKFKLELQRVEVGEKKKEHEVDFTDEVNAGGGGRRGGSSGPTIVAVDKITQYKYTLAIDNKSDVEFKNVTLEYRIFYEQEKAVLDEKANQGRDEDSTRPERYMAVEQNKVKDGKVRIKPIKSGEIKEISTGATVLIKRSATRPWEDKINLKCNLTGAWIKLTMKGPDGEELVRDIATSSTIMKKYSWEIPEEEAVASSTSPESVD